MLRAGEEERLIAAIQNSDTAQVHHALAENADVNFYKKNTPTDFAKADWTPLMKAIAKMNSSIITTQSLINTVYNISKYAFIGGTAAAGALSLWQRSPYALLATAAITGTAMLGCTPLIKSANKKIIDAQHNTVKLILKHEALDKKHQDSNGVSAQSLCHHGHALLHSPDLCPPYHAYTPEQDYVEKLDSIEAQLTEQAQHTISTSKCAKFISTKQFAPINAHDKLPIIFDPSYDISFGGIEQLHPFDTKKYGKICNYLLKNLNLIPSQLYNPERVSDTDLLLVHSPEYLKHIANSFNLGMIADLPLLGLFPNRIAQKTLLEPVKLATGGTILGADLALKHGWAINLSGGYHHAKSMEPVLGGFCIINDICIAAKKVLNAHPGYRILIVDLDAHQGNGHEEIAQKDPNIAIFDMYNGDTWPGDFECQERINFNLPLKARTQDAEYIHILSSNLPQAIDYVQPDLIIYNAGTDVYEKDPIGALSLTKQGIIERDRIVFTEAIGRKIPILMVLSGGYHADSHAIISESIMNLRNTALNK